jgi:hypothetical protein
LAEAGLLVVVGMVVPRFSPNTGVGGVLGVGLVRGWKYRGNFGFAGVNEKGLLGFAARGGRGAGGWRPPRN